MSSFYALCTDKEKVIHLFSPDRGYRRRTNIVKDGFGIKQKNTTHIHTFLDLTVD